MTVVLLSGGMDSAVALSWACAHRPKVKAFALHYGQRHATRELDAARKIAALMGVELIRHDMSIPWAPMAGSVLPGRNGILLSVAATYSASLDDTAEVVIGACAADAAGFPDCRPEYLLAKQRELTLGLGVEVTIAAPLIDRTKAQIVRLAREVGAWEALALSWSCYLGGERPCGECPACVFRAEGFREAGEEDPWTP